jgi:glycerol kinase
VIQKTGLLLDPYFSATKIAWILDQIPGVREEAEKGECLFGTIDTFLLWRLTGGKMHATDATNASRTALFNIKTQTWDDELLTLFKIPRAMLPEVKDSADTFGTTDATVLGHAIPICALIGDQQAATVGQACIQPGMVKSTYGTGCFLVVNTGDTLITSTHQLLSTTAYRLKGKPTYALEGSIFIAGAAIQWLRDGLKIIPTAADTERLAMSIPSSGGVVVVPAFTGLGAPYWNPKARGAIFGITRDTTAAHIVRATLEAVCFSTRDLLEAVHKDTAQPLQTLRVDGGMVANNWFTQTLADILHMPIARPTVYETTALGAAFLAGLGVGLFKQLSDITQFWKPEKQFEPHMGDIERQQLYHHWMQAIGKVQS